MLSISPDALRLGLCLFITPLHALRYAFPRSQLRDLTFLSLFLITLTAIFSIKSSNAAHLVRITSLANQWLWVAGNFLLIDPELSRRRNRDVPIYDITKEPSTWKRFLWGLEYATSSRGINWNWQVSGVAAISPRENRAHFLWQAAKRIVTWYIMLDLIANYKEAQPFWASYGMEPGYASSADGGFVRMIVNGMVTMASVYGGIQLVYTVVSFLTVLVGISEPKSWPPFFGNITETHTLRYFWGRFWHQLLRDIFMMYSEAFLSFLGLQRRTYAYRYAQLYTIFAISAFIHTIISATVPYPNGVPEGKNTPYMGSDQIVFFMLQAIAVHVEDTVIELFGKSKQKTVATKLLGWTWLILWFGMTARYLTDELTIGGMDEAAGKPQYSLVQALGIKF